MPERDSNQGIPPFRERISSLGFILRNARIAIDFNKVVEFIPDRTNQDIAKQLMVRFASEGDRDWRPKQLIFAVLASDQPFLNIFNAEQIFPGRFGIGPSLGPNVKRARERLQSSRYRLYRVDKSADPKGIDSETPEGESLRNVFDGKLLIADVQRSPKSIAIPREDLFGLEGILDDLTDEYVKVMSMVQPYEPQSLQLKFILQPDSRYILYHLMRNYKNGVKYDDAVKSYFENYGLDLSKFKNPQNSFAVALTRLNQELSTISSLRMVSNRRFINPQL